MGVVADAVYLSLRELPRPSMYLPLAQHDQPFVVRVLGTVNLNIRAANDSPSVLAKSVAVAIGSVNPRITLSYRPLAEQLNDSLARERVVATIAGFFGGLALLLAGVGLYGVTAYTVARRRGEIGIRMALGATRSQVIRLVMTRVSWLVGMGIGLGAFVSVWASRAVASLLYGLEAGDPITLAGAAVILMLVAVVASGIPAHRASRLDTAEVLREG